VEECLLNRLRTATGLVDLVPIHRLDRDTAGVVLFSVNKKTRGQYQQLFMQGSIEKTYYAMAHVPHPPREREWTLETRIVRGTPSFRMHTVPGAVNARTHIQLTETNGCRALFRLRPITGKTHQLRLHMSGLGFPIINDRMYPDLQPKRDDDFNQPLKLLATEVRFQDPVCGTDRVFQSRRELAW
jgi:tRNA pseudouridine32 synthase/23S rRNA pseudouridine746 synthase